MTAHIHEWLRDLSRSRYTCACGVVGHNAQNLPGQYRTGTKYIVPFRCQHRTTDRAYCGAEATYVTGDRQRNRCAVHAVKKTRAA